MRYFGSSTFALNEDVPDEARILRRRDRCWRERLQRLVRSPDAPAGVREFASLQLEFGHALVADARLRRATFDESKREIVVVFRSYMTPFPGLRITYRGVLWERARILALAGVLAEPSADVAASEIEVTRSGLLKHGWLFRKPRSCIWDVEIRAREMIVDCSVPAAEVVRDFGWDADRFEVRTSGPRGERTDIRIARRKTLRSPRA